MKRKKVLILWGCLCCVVNLAVAKPYVPSDDTLVLERLPSGIADDRAKQTKQQRQALLANPNDLSLAVEVARDYVELGRVTGDPRFAGYAQSALAPWWNDANAPLEVALLRAQLRQRTHAFEEALIDLDRVLAQDPRNSQARLQRAIVHQVRADFARAQEDCAALKLSELVLGLHCEAQALSMTGRLDEAYRLLVAVINPQATGDDATQAWLMTALAELAERGGDTAAAERYYAQALLLAPTDQYGLMAYADFLLTEGRPAQVMELLAPHRAVDGVLLRYALAARAAQSTDAQSSVDDLSARIAATRARGESAHKREEARFALEIENNATRALALAQENWAVQKEPADLRLLVAAARAAKADLVLDATRAWIARHGYQDARLPL